MMRSLWTAASGMISQQQNVDTISNNLANVNTYGYKKERMEFKTLLYDTMQRADRDAANQTGRPVNLQVGVGVRPIAVSRIFSQGNLETTDNNQDLAIQGDGFFAVQRNDGTYYTKDGAFKWGISDQGNMLTTSEGYPVLDTNDEPVVIPSNVLTDSVTIDQDGNISYKDTSNQPVDLGVQVKLVQFPNPQGLEGVGSNLLRQTSASGDPLNEADGEVNVPSQIMQGTLEMSNVEVADEMVNLIVAERAYELNSKAITTSDDMLSIANGLKR